MSTDKMNTSEVFEMFETINNKLDKRQTDKSADPTQIDLATVTAINTMTERFEIIIAEVRKPVKVEHRHTIDIGSSKVFLSLVVMILTILGLSYAIGEQRRSISQYRDNDLKYRYIKMQGQTNEENIYRLEDTFEYRDSVILIRKQVAKYEKLLHEQAERMARARKETNEVESIEKNMNMLKNRKQMNFLKINPSFSKKLYL
jgi:hypothetical protein